MPLKRVQYQEDTLDALRAYLSDARAEGPASAFDKAIGSLRPELQRGYANLAPQLGAAPYVCLRLPTGGGKTLLAARAIPIAGREFLEQDFPLVLWLVPTNTIREQTQKALTTPGNIHYEVMHDQFNGRFRVLDISDFTNLRPHDLGTRANIIVSTLATGRVDDRDLRTIYDHNEALEPFFATISPNTPGLDTQEPNGRKRKGRAGQTEAPASYPDVGAEKRALESCGPVRFSFMNLLRYHRPLVIVDEAHNNASDLSNEVMIRINPSCIIEFTATPAASSNILYNVTADELLAAGMIKLPIELTQHPTWQEAVHNAVQERQKLAELANAEPDYIRPIVLIQAENIDEEVTWKIVREYLLNEEKIAAERIAVVTGKERELDDINLFARDCPIDFVITVKALKEGWDCSFAYVFCSVATVHSKTEVEQILGRVLRMPYAQRRTCLELNRAYAHVSSASWPTSVKQMRDRLVAMGFDEVEAENAIHEQRRLSDPGLGLQYRGDVTAGLPLFDVSVRETPDLSNLEPEEAAFVTVHKHPDGLTTLTVDEIIPDATLRKVEQKLLPKDRVALREHLDIRRRQRQRDHAPARQGKRLAVPLLYRAVQDELVLVDQDTLLDTAGWKIADYPATLSAAEFSTEVEAQRYEIGIENRRVTQRYLGAQMTLDLKHMEEPWSEERTVNWLDEHLQETNRRTHNDIGQGAMRDFVLRAVRHLLNDRRLTLADLQLYCYSLQKALERKITDNRHAAARKGFQRLLALPATELRTNPEHPFVFPPEGYQPHWYYQGTRKFDHHYYPDVGELKSDGEEFDCAVVIDQCQQVEYWVRNLDHGDGAFHLPTPYGNFHPDFITLLKDSRYLVVEYKGEQLEGKTSEQAKRDIGTKWEEASNGTGIFLWAVKKDAAGRDVEQQLKTRLAVQK